MIEGMFGMSYVMPGWHTEEYVEIVAALLHGEAVDQSGRSSSTLRGVPAKLPNPCNCSSPRRRHGCCASPAPSPTGRSCGWATPVVESHVAPLINAAASRPAGATGAAHRRRPAVARDDDVDPGDRRRQAVRDLRHAADVPADPCACGVDGPAEAAIVGDEAAVASQLQGLVDAGVTDIWASIFPVGDDASGPPSHPLSAPASPTELVRARVAVEQGLPSPAVLVASAALWRSPRSLGRS
ncbi:MAG: hypothetical protein QM760_21685 [Nibricoccus sp.]